MYTSIYPYLGHVGGVPSLCAERGGDEVKTLGVDAQVGVAHAGGRFDTDGTIADGNLRIKVRGKG